MWKAAGGNFHGTYQISGNPAGMCQVGNPFAGGGCGCPGGSSPYLSGEYYLNGFWQIAPDVQYTCVSS